MRSKIKKVTVHYPEGEKMDQLNEKYCKAVAKILIETLPLELIDEIIDKLKSKETAS